LILKALCEPQGFCIEKKLNIVYYHDMVKTGHSKSQSDNRSQENRPELLDFDISMLIENLKRTPAERIRRHQIALNAVWKLRKAKLIPSQKGNESHPG
jgi:hypothetical protein